MNLKVTVTQEDIDKGCQQHTNNCAMARAIERAANEAAGRNDIIAFVGDAIRLALASDCEIGTSKIGGRKYYITPPSHVVLVEQELTSKQDQFISDFDSNRKSVKPFSFTLTV